MKRVKTLEALPPGLCMAKRLTKALRGKRRWVGLVTAHSLQSRSEIERKVEEIMKELNLSKAPRLMDFFRPDSETSRHFCSQNPNGPREVGVMILRIAHEDTPSLRAALSEPTALETHGMMTYTTSGKIRLVRERMGIARPKRNND